MKNFNVVEMLVAFFITLVSGIVAGIAPIIAASIAFVFYFSCALATDIIGHIRDKKLPSICEGIGDVCLFAAIIFVMVSLKRQNVLFTFIAAGFILIDCVLIYVQGRIDGKSSTEALEGTKKETKE